MSLFKKEHHKRVEVSEPAKHAEPLPVVAPSVAPAPVAAKWPPEDGSHLIQGAHDLDKSCIHSLHQDRNDTAKKYCGTCGRVFGPTSKPGAA